MTVPVDPIPLVDLKLAHLRVADEVTAGISELFESASFVLGPQVDQFEREFAAFSGARHCVGVANGTDAIELALRASGIGIGDDVVIPANTFVATAEGVVRAGARPILADVRDDYLIDPDSVIARLTPSTKAVVGVHLYGQMAPFAELIEKLPSNVLLFEDAAQSQGAAQDGRTSGSVGTAAATSFYPGKNLGAYGDAGAILTSDDEIADLLRSMRNHGGTRRYEHLVVGTNSRLDSIQAIVLSAKLRLLEAWNAERRAAAEFYGQLLSGEEEVSIPVVARGNLPVWHLYVVRVPNRDFVLQRLNRVGIGAGIHYPAPIHLLPAFSSLGHGSGDFPVAEAHASQIISLPLYPGISHQQQERVVTELALALADSRARQ